MRKSNERQWGSLAGSSTPLSCVCVEADIEDVEFNHDLVCKDALSEDERRQLVLDYFGLEVVEVNEPRIIWVAHHDGRKLKNYKEVLAPVPYDGGDRRKAGMMTSMSSAGFDMVYLFEHVMDDQDRDAKADCILIIDQTGIKDKVSLESPCFEGPEGVEIARKWFRDEFGVTFTEETRASTTYVVRYKPTTK